MKKHMISILLALTLLAGALTGCGGQQAGESAQPEQVTVTMFGFWNDKTNDIIHNLKVALKEKYPEISLEYEAFPTSANPYSDELTRRVSHGREADLFMTTDTALGSTGALLNFTDQEFVSRYSVAIMQEQSDDGNVYYLPGVGYVQCYIYNPQQIPNAPQTLDELERMMVTSAKDGGHPFIVAYDQMPTLMLKTLSVGYLASPQGQVWLDNYNNGSATMTGNAAMEAAWSRVERLVKQGVFLKTDMVFTEGRRIGNFAQGGGDMTTVSSSILQQLYSSDGAPANFALLPFLGDEIKDQTVISAPTCYFAASARLDEAGNEAKKEAVLKILDFISTEEGQSIIRSNSILSNSFLDGVQFDLTNQNSSLVDILRSGAYGPEPIFDRGVETAMGEAFGRLLKGEITAAEAVSMCDTANTSYVAQSGEKKTSTVLGTATTEFPWTYRDSRTKELAITNFVADCMREAAATDLAIELGTTVRGEFFQGEITDQDIPSVLRQDKKLYRTEVTGQQLWNIIEQGILEDNSSWFMTVSGMKYSYTPAQGEVPGKLLTLEMADGKPIEREQTYLVAVSENQMMEVPGVTNFFGIPAEEVSITLREAVAKNIQKQGKISPLLDGRISVVAK